MRKVFAVLCVGFVAVGCGGAEEPDSEYSVIQADLKPAPDCSALYEPVCGKDGKTYSNECYAGGPGRVAYSGECTTSTTSGGGGGKEDLCAVVRCAAGTHCVVRRQQAVCIAD